MKQIQFISVTPEQLQQTILDGVKQHLTEFKKQLQAPEELMTRDETSKFLKVNLSTLHNWQKQGKLIPFGIQGRVYYKRSDIMKSIVKLH
jgi:hypothetical protein